ncbi:hypothetical protein DSO57_1023435 [Entomophthora muscae]|uniref:Uncharacterized protein n=1 Tax=Entomophthora muscae TaxID=34485 RepID=A0ACC2UPY0_9FUNG|nr:hypothetical protein DSO57_1023435 [Entomophthora muscae]
MRQAIIEGLVVLLSLGAIVISLLICYIGVFRNCTRGVDMILLVVMSLLDSGMGMMWLSLLLTKWAVGHDILQIEYVCNFQAMLYIFMIESSSDCAVILSLLRFGVIVQGWRVRRWLWLMVVVFVLVTSLAFSVAATSYNLNQIMPNGSYCEPVTTKDIPFSIFYRYWLLGRIIISPIIISICYASITIRYYTFITGASLPILRSLPRLLVGCVAYAVCFLPTIFTSLYQVVSKKSVSADIDCVVFLSALSIIIINPLFAVLVHDETKREFVSLMHSANLIFNPKWDSPSSY